MKPLTGLDAGDRRYRDSCIDAFPGVWRHGDWIDITQRGGAIIYGRSDATINRHGIRVGRGESLSTASSIADAVANPASLDWFVTFAATRPNRATP